MPANPLRRKLQQGRTVYGAWVTLESANVSEALAGAGVDWIVIEMEHGHLDWRDVANHLRAVAGSDTAALIRVADVQRDHLQRALDLGADGVICPMIDCRAALESAFRWGRYPPRGIRGVGGERAVRWGLRWEEYLHQANTETLIVPLLESPAALQNIDEILEVDGLELVFFGPSDYSASSGYLGQWEGPGVAEAILRMQQQAAARGVAAGILGRTVPEARLREQQGFRMIGLGADINLMLAAIQEKLNQLG